MVIRERSFFLDTGMRYFAAWIEVFKEDQASTVLLVEDTDQTLRGKMPPFLEVRANSLSPTRTEVTIQCFNEKAVRAFEAIVSAIEVRWPEAREGSIPGEAKTESPEAGREPWRLIAKERDRELVRLFCFEGKALVEIANMVIPARGGPVYAEASLRKRISHLRSMYGTVVVPYRNAPPQK